MTADTNHHHEHRQQIHPREHQEMAKKTDAPLALKPLDDRVVVEPTEAEEKTSGGILLPDTAKQLLYTDDARKKLLTGAEKLAHAVGITLGPTGRNVIIDKSFGGPTVTKDGVTVSKEIDLPDPFENMGAKLVNAVAQKTSDAAGDGTTTATVLALAT